MGRKLYTLLIFPGAHGKVHKIQLPIYTAHLVLIFAVVGIMTVAALANSYARMLLKVSNYDSLRTEREALKSQYRTLEGVVDHTNAKLGSLQSLAAEVALTYGFGEERHPRFPHSIIALATQSNSSLDSSYRASLYAFNFMRSAAFDTVRGSIKPSGFVDAAFDRSTMPAIWPVRGQVSAGFGQRLDPLSGEGAFHAGLDLRAPMGSIVQSTADGLVFFAGRDAGYGNAVLIDHGYGITTKYGHLSRIVVVVGQEVKKGQIIGAVGMTGRSTGPHLHYEVKLNDTPVNPYRYLGG
jgi:murein DD-endopeptidase MepM/ murein hydrolase activator NlpD